MVVVEGSEEGSAERATVVVVVVVGIPSTTTRRDRRTGRGARKYYLWLCKNPTSTLLTLLPLTSQGAPRTLVCDSFDYLYIVESLFGLGFKMQVKRDY